MNENDVRLQNLTPFTSEQDREEAVKNGRKGGRASGKVRRQKKLMKEQMEYLLSLPVVDEEVKEELRNSGIDPDEIDNQMLLIVALYKKALTGDVQAFNTLRDTIGEKPKEAIEISRDTEETEKEIGDYLLCKKKQS